MLALRVRARLTSWVRVVRGGIGVEVGVSVSVGDGGIEVS